MKIELNKVYNMDCIELMQEMKAQGIKADWLITDPPYGISFASDYALRGGEQNGKTLCPKKQYLYKDWDDKRIDKKYFDLMFEVSKNQIIFGANYYTDCLPPTKSWLVWDKRCSEKMQNNFCDCEFMWCSQGVARIFRYLYNGMLEGNMKNKQQRFHPTQKPLQIMYQLINYYTKENDLIFDPFMGSFTTAVACHKLNRNFLGAEIDKDYYKLGSERLAKEQAQVSIFDIVK